MEVPRRDRRTRDRDVPIRRVRSSDNGYVVSQRFYRLDDAELAALTTGLGELRALAGGATTGSASIR